MFLLILESLGSTELVFILIMALVFFGPRKLPQISLTLGKSLADFRRASEDFKRTWDKEVSLEEIGGGGVNSNQFLISEENSTSENETATASLQPPSIGTIAPERVIARHTLNSESPRALDATSEQSQGETENQITHSPKSEWL